MLTMSMCIREDGPGVRQSNMLLRQLQLLNEDSITRTDSQSCSRVPSTGTRTGTGVRVLVPGYGYNEMGMGTSTGAKPC